MSVTLLLIAPIPEDRSRKAAIDRTVLTKVLIAGVIILIMLWIPGRWHGKTGP